MFGLVLADGLSFAGDGVFETRNESTRLDYGKLHKYLRIHPADTGCMIKKRYPK